MRSEVWDNARSSVLLFFLLPYRMAFSFLRVKIDFAYLYHGDLEYFLRRPAVVGRTVPGGRGTDGARGADPRQEKSNSNGNSSTDLCDASHECQ